jgi:hypothetical protein
MLNQFRANGVSVFAAVLCTVLSYPGALSASDVDVKSAQESDSFQPEGLGDLRSLLEIMDEDDNVGDGEALFILTESELLSMLESEALESDLEALEFRDIDVAADHLGAIIEEDKDLNIPRGRQPGFLSP